MIPQSTVNAVKKRAKGRCEDCGERTRLELHHLRYRSEPDFFNPHGLDIRGKETPDDLRALCRQCHYQRHIDLAGRFWRDPQAMAEHWSSYHEESERG